MEAWLNPNMVATTFKRTELKGHVCLQQVRIREILGHMRDWRIQHKQDI